MDVEKRAMKHGTNWAALLAALAVVAGGLSSVIAASGTLGGLAHGTEALFAAAAIVLLFAAGIVFSVGRRQPNRGETRKVPGSGHPLPGQALRQRSARP